MSNPERVLWLVILAALVIVPAAVEDWIYRRKQARRESIPPRVSPKPVQTTAKE